MTAIANAALPSVAGPCAVRCTRATGTGAWHLEAPGPGGAGWAPFRHPATRKEIEAVLSDVENHDMYGRHGSARRAVFARIAGAWVLDCATEPAYVSAVGNQEWLRNGKIHRDGDQPAVTVPGPGGYSAWYCEGLLHRVAGPASIFPGAEGDGAVQWFLDGEDVSARMKELLGCLELGGRVVNVVESPGRGCAGQARVISLDGEPDQDFAVASVAWVAWIIEHSDERYPELAAALRVKAMRDGAASAGPGSVQEDAVVSVAAPLAPRRRRL